MKKVKTLIAVVVAGIIFSVCGGSGGSGSSGSIPSKPGPPAPITCPGCPAPAAGITIWSPDSIDPFSVYLLVDGQMCLDNEAWLATANYYIRFRQYNPVTEVADVTGAWDHTGRKPGCYMGVYSVISDNSQFCPGETWCSDTGAWIELYVDDGLTQWHSYATPGVPY